jgi:N-acyl-D-aspartate/D-glutamate deacylase
MDTHSAPEDLIGTIDPDIRWYVTAQHNGKTSLVYGPCTKEDAETMKPFVAKVTDKVAPGTLFWTWGIAEWTHATDSRPLGVLTRSINEGLKP